MDGGQSSIADDNFISFTPSKAIGMLMMGGRHTNYRGVSALIVYGTVTTAFCEILGQPGTNVERRTGVLNGTTGTDGRVTVSAHTDGKIYIENRFGQTISINWQLFGS